MKVSEIFYSLSGEGIHAGIPTIFVRLAGCNLDCTFCDTQYARNGGEEMTVDEAVAKVRGLRRDGWILITGGEPLFQLDAVFRLVAKLGCGRCPIEIETNGSIVPPSWFKLVSCWSVDVKCPSSGSYGTFRTKWLKRMRKQDQLKFVVGTKDDLNFVEGFLSNSRLRPTVLVSPVIPAGSSCPLEDGLVGWRRPWLQEVAEFCKEQNVRMSLQLHKIIWGDKRGV